MWEMKDKMKLTKEKHGKRFAAAAVSGLLAAAVLITAVLSRKIEAEAAETFLGIEELRNEVAESGRTYTILEIVPDRNGAEIGFLTDGYEPVLSTWNEEKQQWESWKEKLCSFATFEERKAYIEGLKVELQAYYDAKGITGDKPVSIAKEEYEESDTKEDGYKTITAAAVEKTGWFAKATAESGETYQVKFKYMGLKENYEEESDWVYYKIDGEPIALTSLTEEELKNLPADKVIYKKEAGEGVFSIKGLWGELNGEESETEETQTETTTETTTEPANEQEPEKETQTETSEETQTETTGETESETTKETESGTEQESSTPESGEQESSTQESSEPESSAPESSEQESSTQESSTPGNDEQENATPKGDEPESPSSENTDTVNTASFVKLSSKSTPDTADSTDVKKEAREEKAAKEQEESKEQNAEETEKTQETAEESATEEKQTEEQSGTEEEQSTVVLAGQANTQETQNVDAQAEETEEYYLVSFVKIEDVTALADTDTIYIVEEGGIIGSSNGDYSFVESSDENVRKQTHTFGGITIYCKNVFTNNEWFKKNALDMEEADYKKFQIQVLTFTPAELNAMNELPKFDFLYLNSGTRLIDSEAEVVNYEKDTMDLSAQVVKNLFEWIAANGTPCLVDGGIMFEKEGETESITSRDDMKETQIFMFAALLCQKQLSKWEQYSGNLAILDLQVLLANITDSDKNFSTEQTYCRFGEDSIINSDFAKATIHEGDAGEVEEGFQSVLDEINLENLYRESDAANEHEMLNTDISEARVLRHIINYKNRRTTETKTNIKVLEIQPALTTEADITLEQLKVWAPDVETVETTIMTTAEFIGKIETLNDKYDLIYIGTSKEHLNIKNWTGGDVKNSSGEYVGSTVFNDSDMDGLIYYNIGDLRVTNMALAGLLDTEYWGNDRSNYPYYYNYMRYNGNDITEEKKEALLSFLDGSYPVIVSDDFIEQPVTVFQNTGYTGYRVSLPVGRYTKEQLTSLGVKTKDISSIKVKEGYEVILYTEDEFNSTELTVDKDADFSTTNTSWNEKTVSMIVKKKDGSTPTRAVDEDHIDNCTYLYEFVEKALENQYNNFFAVGELEEGTAEGGSELFKFYLNRPKVSVVNTLVNGTKEDGSDIYYVSADAFGKYQLQYTFTIKNEGAATYDTKYCCKLYIDVNSDGKYSKQEEVSDIAIYQNGSQVSSEELYADREYVLKRQVPDGYKGLLPWKIEITQCNNDNIYTSMNGYTKLKGMEKEVLNIIQIGRDKFPDLSWFGGNNESLFDLGAEINNKNSVFHKLIYGGTVDGQTYKGISDEFEINVTFLTISEYEEKMAKPENADYLKDFNMLILGFSDMYGNISGTDTTGAMGAIIDFINSGKSVLFAHDTTSFFNYPTRYSIYSNNYARSNAYPWRNNPNDSRSTGTSYYYYAAGLNTYVRPLVGMDRYGILSSSVLKKGNILSTDSDEFKQVAAMGKDIAYKPKSGKTKTVPEVQGYTYTTINSKDQKVNSSSNSYNRYELDMSKSETWRFTNSYLNIRYDTVYYKDSKTDTGEIPNPYNGEIDNLYVTQVNNGQITEYPYKLPEKFEVAETHGQYYQLDYTADDDGDGQSDLVVWYCLSTQGTGSSEKQTIYSQSPNDVRNNYYIYNKGNVTYTGMGHKMHSSSKYTVAEAKLFINTMIASYQAGIKPPTIAVKENSLKESPEIHTMYRFYDDANGISLNDDATVENSEKVYFTVSDVNFVKGTRSITSHVYYDDGSGTGDTTIPVNDGIKVTKLDDKIYDATTGALTDANNLQSGGIYYILVPKSIMNNCDKGLTLYFEAQSTITSYTNENKTNEYITDKVYAELEVLKAYLFDLD